MATKKNQNLELRITNQKQVGKSQKKVNRTILILLLLIGAVGYLLSIPMIGDKVAPMVKTDSGTLAMWGQRLYSMAKTGLFLWLGFLTMGMPLIGLSFLAWAAAAGYGLYKKFV